MSFFGTISRGVGDVMSLPAVAMRALGGGGFSASPQTAATMGAIGMSPDDDPYSITPSQAPQPGVLGQIPAPPPQNPILGGIDNLLFHGAFGNAQQQAYARQLASFNFQRQIDLLNSLPPAQRAAAMLNPGELGKAMASNTAQHTVAEGTTDVLNGGPSSGGSMFTAPKIVTVGGNLVSATPDGASLLTPNGPLSGNISVDPTTGAVVDQNRGVIGRVAVPQKLAPTDRPSMFNQPGLGTPQPLGAPQPTAQPAALVPAPPPSAVPPPPEPPNPNGPPVQATFTFRSPVADGTPVTSGFGQRARPMKGATSNHLAVDYGGALGAPVVAAGPGVVTFTGRRGGYGNTVMVKHPDGSVSQYSHLSAIAAKAGQPINGGDPIGAIGQTGTATGPNLHFAMFDPSGKPVDPRTRLGATSGTAANAPTATTAAAPPADGWTVGAPAGGTAQRYQIVDGSQVPGGKAGERYTVDTMGVEKPTPVAGGFDPQMVAQRGSQFMDSEDYKNSANTISAVNGLVRTMKTVGPGAPLSWASLDTAMRAFNPSMGVRQNAIQAFMEEVGLPAEVQSEIMKFQGQGFVPPEVQRQLMSAAYAYAESHSGILQQRHQANVDWAKAHGYTEGDLGENLPQVAPFPLEGPPKPQDLVAGRVYDTPKGALKWTGKGFVPAGQP